jgi:putative ABC transport system permease protein
MLSDFRFALRQLFKRPGFSVVAILTLALGIGVNTTTFTMLNAVVLEVSSSPDSGRLVTVFRTSPQSQTWPHSPANFYDYQKQNTAFEKLAAFYPTDFNLAETGQPAERLAGVSVTGDYFPLLGVAPELGRVLGPDDDRPGAGQVAVLSNRFWRGHFAADPGVIGRRVRMDGQPVTIVGIMPDSFEEPLYFGHIDGWRPMALNSVTRQVRDNNWLLAIGRLKPSASLAGAQAEAAAIATRLAHDFPQTNAQNGLNLVPWNQVRVPAVSRSVSWLCMGLAGFVLLIACANLANLQLARMSERVREHAVRIALGASRLQLMRQLLVESLLLSAVGGLLGVLIASWGTRLIGSSIYITGIYGMDLPIDGTVLGFTLVAAAATGIVSGTIPAWIAARTDVNTSLKQGSRGTTGDRSRHRLRSALIVSELALALVLLCGAGYFVRGMQRLAHADMGWKPDGLVTATLSLPYSVHYATDAQCNAFAARLGAKLAALPGEQQAAISAYLPVLGFWQSGNINIQGRTFSIGKEPLVNYDSVSPGYFQTLGMHQTQGREFTDADRPGSTPVAVINETMAKVLWPGENPLGKRIADGGGKDSSSWLEVVGVVNDVHPTVDLVRPPDTPFQVYLPFAQKPAHYICVAVQSTAPDATVAAALRAAVQQLDSDEPVYAIVSARESMEQITHGLTMVGKMLGVFSLVGLALSAVGIYGVIANLVAQRTSEIGIRMALGAQARDVLWLVLGQGLRLSVAGTAIGLACAWALVRLLHAVLPSIPGGDPAALACMVALLSCVALFACWLPARRATKVDPIIALRSE